MHHSSKPLEMLARWGFAARGVVYCLVGGLALLAAIGSGGQTGGSHSALSALLGEPFGQAILMVIAIGLAGFAAWRILEALTDADRRGASWRALGIRAAHLLSGLVYGGLASSALGLAFGWAAGRGEDAAARDWTAWLLAQPLGQWLVGAIGLAIVGAGLGFLAKGWRGDVTAFLRCERQAARWIVPLGRFGFAARGVVFVLMGGFLVVAAIHSNSAEVRGLGGALRALQEQAYGWVLLGIVAAGLFAFGIFGLVQAYYRQIDAPDLDDARASMAEGLNSLRS